MKVMFRKMDKVLFFLMLGFTIFGLVMIFSASSITAVLYQGVPEYYYFQKQVFIIVAAWIFGLFVLFMPTNRYRFWGPVGMLGILAALFFLIPYGSIINSTRRWYDLGFFLFQPSEFAQSIVIVYLAVYFDKIVRQKKCTLNNIIMPFIFVLGAAGLTAMQPDLGTAIIIAGIAFFIFMALPINFKEMRLLKMLGIGGVVIAASALLFGGSLLNAEQASRLNFKAPCTRYTDKTGYQVCNGFIAIANGGLFGAGLGNSKQKYLYLPEAHTDFIFPIIVEELGVLIGVLVIILYLVMLYRLLKIARNAANLRGSIMAYGTFAYLLIHLIVNFMGILALIPLTGLPVPFLSYGGSIYINVIFLMFLSQRVQVEAVDARKAKILAS